VKSRPGSSYREGDLPHAGAGPQISQVAPVTLSIVNMFTRAGRAALFDRKVYTEAFFDNDAMADGAIVVASVGALTYLGFLARGASST
jgi:hypothetical protein